MLDVDPLYSAMRHAEYPLTKTAQPVRSNALSAGPVINPRRFLALVRTLEARSENVVMTALARNVRRHDSAVNTLLLHRLGRGPGAARTNVQARASEPEASCKTDT